MLKITVAFNKTSIYDVNDKCLASVHVTLFL